ncbi:hypothetical protein B0H11DRAFT_1916366 [Mycena galericulata]|nr:hypothetical protein B0H11DRAFT_1916366 [Mycena galericulata]
MPGWLHAASWWASELRCGSKRRGALLGSIRAAHHPVDGLPPVLTGPERERSVTRWPSFYLWELPSYHFVFDSLGVFLGPVDGHFRWAQPSKTQSKSLTERSATRRSEPIEPARRARRTALGSIRESGRRESLTQIM